MRKRLLQDDIKTPDPPSSSDIFRRTAHIPAAGIGWLCIWRNTLLLLAPSPTRRNLD